MMFLENLKCFEELKIFKNLFLLKQICEELQIGFEMRRNVNKI